MNYDEVKLGWQGQGTCETTWPRLLSFPVEPWSVLHGF